MPNAPTAYPLGGLTVSGTTVTFDELVEDPTRITRDIADLATSTRWFMDQVFTSAGGVDGGALLFERPNTIANDLFGDREPKEVAPGEEFPLQTFSRGVPMVARPRKIGNKWFVVKEAVKRNKQGTLRRNMIQTANTIRRRIENLGLAELSAVVTAETRYTNGTDWSAYAGTALTSRTGTTGPVADVMAALASADNEERGVEFDSMILNTINAMEAKQAYPGMTLKQIFSDAGDPEEEGSGIRNIYVTPRQTLGRALLFESGRVGEWRNEFPLEEETEWEGVAAGGKQRWWYQWSISPMFVVEDQFALLELRGL